MKKVKTIFRQFPFLLASRLVVVKLFNKVIGVNAREFYGQTGEDIIINFFLENEKGLFVDVGCNHPISFSNTFELYKKGWTGLNIDANPELIKKYTVRPNDISVCEAVSDETKEMLFHEFEQAEVSTLETAVIDEWKTRWDYKKSRKVTTKTLTQILDEHSIPNAIDFLSVDVEGHDFQVLNSLDFNKYQPKLILIEMHQFNVADYQANKIVQFLIAKGYELVGFVTMNGYFKLKTN